MTDYLIDDVVFWLVYIKDAYEHFLLTKFD